MNPPKRFSFSNTVLNKGVGAPMNAGDRVASSGRKPLRVVDGRALISEAKKRGNAARLAGTLPQKKHPDWE